jgi:molybdopterin converting factor small subunit
MQHVKLNLYATLRAYLGGRASTELEIEPEETLGAVLARLGIPHEQTRILFINNRHATLDQPLHGGDQVAVFPAIGGG